MADAPDAMSPPPRFRLREGWMAAAAMLAAALVLLGFARTAVIALSDQRPLFPFAAVLIALALPGPLLRSWDVFGQLMLWNAAGWCLGLIVMGMTSIGAQTMLPFTLLIFAISFWPRRDDLPALWGPGAIAFAGGFLACFILWEDLSQAMPLG